MRDMAKRLPFSLGLTEHEEGRWEDFIVVEPDRCLPWYAAQRTGDEHESMVSAQELDHFLRAHHAAGFHGLICDRLDDGQVIATPELVALRSLLLRYWH